MMVINKEKYQSKLNNTDIYSYQIDCSICSATYLFICWVFNWLLNWNRRSDHKVNWPPVRQDTKTKNKV